MEHCRVADAETNDNFSAQHRSLREARLAETDEEEGEV